MKQNMREFSDEINKITHNKIEISKQVHQVNFDEIISPMFSKAK